MEIPFNTIEEVREQYKSEYKSASIIKKIQLKCWINYAEKRHERGQQPLSFDQCIACMSSSTYVNFIAYDTIDCSDVGGKDRAISYTLALRNI